MSEPTRHESQYGVIYLGGVPEALDSRLADLYESTFSHPVYFRIFLSPDPHCAWELPDPPHVIEFDVRGSAAVVLNALFPIDSGSLRAFCTAVFAALPGIDRIRFSELMCNPADLGLPFRVDRMVDDTVLGLPPTREEYLNALGWRTRRNLRYDVRRLEHEHPTYKFEVFERRQITESLVSDIIDLHRRRVQARGDVTGVDAAYESRLQALLQECGLVGSLTIGNAVAAGTLGTRVRRNYFGHVAAFNSAYEHLHPGLLSMFFTVNACIDREMNAYHFLWGGAGYKRWLGGTTEDLYFVTVFRHARARYLHPKEEAAFQLPRVRPKFAKYAGLPERATRKAARWLDALIRRSPDRSKR